VDAVSKAQQNGTEVRKKWGRPFEKGEKWRGNAGGRPKKKPITALFEQLLEEAVDREAIKSQIRQTLTSRGMAGVLLLKEAADRVEGKVPQGVEVSGEVTIALSERLEKARKRKDGKSNE
jgi:hypothetical protein